MNQIIMIPNQKSSKDSLFQAFCNWNKKSCRYAQLKNIAAKAVRNKKIFVLYGHSPSVRAALVERGWVEKIPSNKINLKNKIYRKESVMNEAIERILLSHFVGSAKPNLVWNARDDWDSKTIHENRTVRYNRLQISHLYATKLGLCAALKNIHWYYIEDVADVTYPRTYSCVGQAEKEDFERDFKLTACTSLLKWVLSMVANERPIFSVSGNIAISVLIFALNRCKEYLFHKENKDIDNCFIPLTTKGQWNAFLKYYYILIAKQDTFETDKDNKLPLFLGYAQFLLKEIHKYRPQLSCEGCHNIWIVKPAHCSRGRGIRMASKLRVLTDFFDQGKFVFQKYIEEPLLIHDTKFDIRQYYMITNTSPLVIWMYKDCYLKFSSQKYDIKNYHESIHLTNNAVQKKYNNCTNRHPELETYNMWSLDTFKEYLKKTDNEYVWDSIIYPGMRNAIVGVMTCCQESISHCQNRFELYGCDFILDKTFKPWLIEINSCPDLNPTTPVTAKICPETVKDMLKVIIDVPLNKKASTGKFECIYRQSLHPLPKQKSTYLFLRGHALPNSYFIQGNPQGVKIDKYSNYSIKGKEEHLNLMLEKFKMINETDIMQDAKPNSSLRLKRMKDFSDVFDSLNDEDSIKKDVGVKKMVQSFPCSTDKFSIINDRRCSNMKHFTRTSFCSSNIIKTIFERKLVDDDIEKNTVTKVTSSVKELYDRSSKIKVIQPVKAKSENKKYNFVEASQKLLSFLMEKEKEYFD